MRESTVQKSALRCMASVPVGYNSYFIPKIRGEMKIYIIEKNQTKRAYLSFNRLLNEETIEVYCKAFGDQIPAKNNLPASLAYGRIIISSMEVDERV